MTKDKSDVKRFPLKLEPSFSKEIDSLVFHTNAETKHQYIMDAIKEKMAKDKITLNMV